MVIKSIREVYSGIFQPVRASGDGPSPAARVPRIRTELAPNEPVTTDDGSIPAYPDPVWIDGAGSTEPHAALHVPVKGELPPPGDPSPCLSRLMQGGIGTGRIREDHSEVNNQVYSAYAEGKRLQGDGRARAFLPLQGPVRRTGLAAHVRTGKNHPIITNFSKSKTILSTGGPSLVLEFTSCSPRDSGS